MVNLDTLRKIKIGNKYIIDYRQFQSKTSLYLYYRDIEKNLLGDNN